MTEQAEGSEFKTVASMLGKTWEQVQDEIRQKAGGGVVVKPQTIAYADVQAAAAPAPAREAAPPQAPALENAEDDAEEHADPLPTVHDVKHENVFPAWVVVPPNFVMPVGKQVFAFRFRAALTDNPSKGERQCILWNLTDSDEKLAYGRAAGNSLRVLDELALQMIRAVDGYKVDWSKDGPAHPLRFWSEIGAKCRNRLKDVYNKRHAFTRDELVDFFTECAAAVTVTG